MSNILTGKAMAMAPSLKLIPLEFKKNEISPKIMPIFSVGVTFQMTEIEEATVSFWQLQFRNYYYHVSLCTKIFRQPSTFLLDITLQQTYQYQSPSAQVHETLLMIIQNRYKTGECMGTTINSDIVENKKKRQCE